MICAKCGINIPDRKNRYYCNKCQNDFNRASSVKRKKLTLKIVGDKCVCCGVSEWWNLEVDHIIPKILRGKYISSYTQYRILTGELNPKDFQTLCTGCNRSKGISGSCRLPHES